MKKIQFILMSAALLSASCARESVTSTNSLEAEALESYIQKYHPDAVKTTLGAYIFPADEVAGTGEEIAEEAYIRVDYTVSDKEGRVTSSTLAEVNKKQGNYNSRNYYGPTIQYRANNSLSAGLEELLTGAGTEFGPMKMGGTRKALIPGWLMTTSRYDTAEEYVSKGSGTTAVYTLTLKDAFDDEETWEKDSLKRYISANFPDAVEDTVISGGGWYYVVTKAVKDTALLAADSTIYCNYTLRDLSGRVIDSNVKKVAQDNGFYSSSATYAPALINWNSDYSQITMTSSSTDVVDGFANAFLHMHQYEAGIAIFWSYLGYYTRGSGSTIPAYCPLRFDIELVASESE